MTVAQYVPGMSPGARMRNLVVGVIYLVMTPVWLAFLWLTLPVMVWGNHDDVARPLSVLPGVSERGGGFAAAMVLLYTVPLYVALFLLLPGDDVITVAGGLMAVAAVALVAAGAYVVERRRAGPPPSEGDPEPFGGRLNADADSFRGTQHQDVAQGGGRGEADDDAG